MTDRTRTALSVSPRLEPLESRRLLAAGDLVSAFGSGGRAAVDFDDRDWQSIDSVVALQDGSIYVIGESGDLDTALPSAPQRPDPVDRQGFVAKLTASGNLDSSFGTGGVAPVSSFAWPDNQPLMGLRLLPDGDLIGQQVVLGDDPSADPFYRLVRLNPDLSLDPAFGSGGVLVINRPSVHWDLLPSGGLAVFSAEFNEGGDLAGSPNALLQLYNADGTPRAGASADLDALLPQSDLTISDLAVDSRGRILLAAGADNNFTFDPLDPVGPYAAAIRLSPDLSLDAGFGDNGVARRGFGSTEVFRASHVAAGDNDTVALVIDEDDNEQAIVLFGNNGDTLFDVDQFRFGTSEHPDSTHLGVNAVERLWVQPDGKVLLSGNYVQDPDQDDFGDPNLAYGVQRFTPDGSDDDAFSGGQTSLAGDDNIRIHSVFLTPDGDLLLGGTAETYAFNDSSQLASYQQQGVVFKLDLGDIGLADDGGGDDGGGDDGGGDDGGGDDGGDNGGGDDGGGDNGGGDNGSGDDDDDGGPGEPAPDSPQAELIDDGAGLSILRVHGTDDADILTVRLEDGRIVVRSGETILDDYDPADISNVEIYGNGGDDLLDSALGIDVISGFVTLRGGDGDDTLLSSSRYDRQYGDAGNDTLTARGDQGLLFGGAGNDTLTGGAGRDLLDGGDGNDVLIGGAGGDALFGGAGHDLLDGGDGDDTLVGGTGNDTHLGGAGIDLIHYIGRTSNVTINLADGTAGAAGENDVLEDIENAMGGSGDDLITGDAGRNFLLGGPGNDSLFGSDGKDTLEGNAGDDLLDGGSDFDWLIDTEGSNTFRGGGGLDVAYGNTDDDFGADVERITTSLDDFLDAI